MVDFLAYCQELEHAAGKRIHVQGQWDNEALHTKKRVLSIITGLFGPRGWVWTTQPSNSPPTNVMDAMMFPALAKMVTAYQGIYVGGRYLQCKCTWEQVLKVWKDYHLDKVGNAFVHHGQVAPAVHSCGRGDGFVQQRRRLSTEVRNDCRLFYGDAYERDMNRSFALSTLVRHDNRAPTGVIVDNMPKEGLDPAELKYPLPNMEEHKISEFLSYERNSLSLLGMLTMLTVQICQQRRRRWRDMNGLQNC